jgi:hypothetical protein
MSLVGLGSVSGYCLHHCRTAVAIVRGRPEDAAPKVRRARGGRPGPLFAGRPAAVGVARESQEPLLFVPSGLPECLRLPTRTPPHGAAAALPCDFLHRLGP